MMNEMVLFAFGIIVAFLMGKVSTQQKSATQTSQMAVIAALFAVAEARGLKNSTVIQRVVERYVPIKGDIQKELTEEAKKIEKQLGEMAELGSVGDFDPEDLV